MTTSTHTSASGEPSGSEPSMDHTPLVEEVPANPSAETAALIAAKNDGEMTIAEKLAGSKRRRNLPGTPDPDAEVVALSPNTLMATHKFTCEICGRGFQREQNLQLHKRGHNLPGTLKPSANKDKEVRKKVYVCPESTCVHHDPLRALGDLTGIKKHFCRKHGEKKWACEKCSKKYAVLSDWKAHSKTCGTRDYKCECGSVFYRRDSFVTHKAFCDKLTGETARLTTVDENCLAVSTQEEMLTSSLVTSTKEQSSLANSTLIKEEKFADETSCLASSTKEEKLTDEKSCLANSTQEEMVTDEKSCLASSTQEEMLTVEESCLASSTQEEKLTVEEGCLAVGSREEKSTMKESCLPIRAQEESSLVISTEEQSSLAISTVTKEEKV